MSENAIQTTGPSRNYSAFDAELTHQALNVRLFVRLLGWMKPYLITLFVSIAFVVLAALAQERKKNTRGAHDQLQNCNQNGQRIARARLN